MEAKKKYLTVDEAVTETGLHPSTVRWLVEAKRMGDRINGQLMVDAEALRAKMDLRRATISATEAAQIYGVTSVTIVLWAKRFDIATKVGCRWRIHPEKLAALVARRPIRVQLPSRRRRPAQGSAVMAPFDDSRHAGVSQPAQAHHNDTAA
jgi:hypothetical protein